MERRSGVVSRWTDLHRRNVQERCDKSVVKLAFAKGASLKDPSGLFNASLECNTRRATDLREGDEVDADAFKTLIRAAVALNRSSAR